MLLRLDVRLSLLLVRSDFRCRSWLFHRSSTALFQRRIDAGEYVNGSVLLEGRIGITLHGERFRGVLR